MALTYNALPMDCRALRARNDDRGGLPLYYFVMLRNDDRRVFPLYYFVMFRNDEPEAIKKAHPSTSLRARRARQSIKYFHP